MGVASRVCVGVWLSMYDLSGCVLSVSEHTL